jgi:hypothetical protein
VEIIDRRDRSEARFESEFVERRRTSLGEDEYFSGLGRAESTKEL